MSESAPVQGEICKTYGPSAIEYLVREKNKYMRELASVQSLIRNMEEWFRDNKKLDEKSLSI